MLWAPQCPYFTDGETEVNHSWGVTHVVSGGTGHPDEARESSDPSAAGHTGARTRPRAPGGSPSSKAAALPQQETGVARVVCLGAEIESRTDMLDLWIWLRAPYLGVSLSGIPVAFPKEGRRRGRGRKPSHPGPGASAVCAETEGCRQGVTSFRGFRNK